MDDPVIGDGALVGEVTTVDPTVSIVTLITDHSFAVTAQVQDGRRRHAACSCPRSATRTSCCSSTSRARPDPGRPAGRDRRLQVPERDLDSLFPAGIPIGQVSNANQNTLINNQTVQVTPVADLRHLDVVQILTTPQAGTAAGAGAVSDLKLLIRLVLLGVVTVVIQEAAVSQISIFGVSADLTPLVVMSVGLLTGSLAGAIIGFGDRAVRRHGARADARRHLAAVHRDRLLVRPAARAARSGPRPRSRWRSARPRPRSPGSGMALIQFLLGVDAPVSLLLLQQIFVTVLVNTLIALPVYALVRRIIAPVLPEDPRRRRRRAYTTGGLSPLQRPSDRLGGIPRSPGPMIQPPEDRRPPMTPQLALRVAVLGSFALAMFAIIFFRLWFLQVLSGDQYLAQAWTNRVRDVSIQAPRGEILDRAGNVLVQSVPSTAVQISPPDLPAAPVARRRLYRRLAFVLGMSDKRSKCPVDGHGVKRLARSHASSRRGWRSCPTRTSRSRPTSRTTSSTTSPSARARSPA